MNEATTLLSAHATLEKEIRDKIDKIFFSLGISSVSLPYYDFEYVSLLNIVEISWETDNGLSKWIRVPITAFNDGSDAAEEAINNPLFDTSDRMLERIQKNAPKLFGRPVKRPHY